MSHGYDVHSDNVHTVNDEDVRQILSETPTFVCLSKSVCVIYSEVKHFITLKFLLLPTKSGMAKCNEICRRKTVSFLFRWHLFLFLLVNTNNLLSVSILHSGFPTSKMHLGFLFIGFMGSKKKYFKAYNYMVEHNSLFYRATKLL